MLRCLLVLGHFESVLNQYRGLATKPHFRSLLAPVAVSCASFCSFSFFFLRNEGTTRRPPLDKVRSAHEHFARACPCPLKAAAAWRLQRWDELGPIAGEWEAAGGGSGSEEGRFEVALAKTLRAAAAVASSVAAGAAAGAASGASAAEASALADFRTCIDKAREQVTAKRGVFQFSLMKKHSLCI